MEHRDNPAWDALVDRYANALRADDRSPLTVRNYRRELQAFARYHTEAFREPPDLPGLTAEDLRDYPDHLRSRKLRPATIVLARAALAGMIKWAHAESLLAEPIRSPRTPRQVGRTPRWLSKPQERRLLKVVRKAGNLHHLGLVELLLVFGTRISETAALTWGDVALGRSRAELRVLGKGSKERTLPFHGNDRARDAFHLLGFKEHGPEKARRIFQGQRGPLTAGGIKQLLTPYGRAAGLDRFSAHVLRHTCARRMFEKGEPVQVIARWMGHESLNTTFLYTLPSEEDLARAAGAQGDGWAEDED